MSQVKRIIDEISLMTFEDWKKFHLAYTEVIVEPVLKKMGGEDEL